MDLTPERACAREIGLKLNELASAEGLNQGMGIALFAQDQSFRERCPSQGEDGIPAFSAEGSGKTRLRQVLSSVKRYRHASCFGLNYAILSNREIADWTVNSDAKFAARASDFGKAVRRRFHRSEHRSLAREYSVRGIAN
jgi:hypothetical protein